MNKHASTVEQFRTCRPEPARLRAETGLTQAELAALVGSKRYQTWQAWERGERGMPLGMWFLALLLTDRHPTLSVVGRPHPAAQEPGERGG